VLPGEITQATVLKTVGPNSCVVQLGACMMSGRGHIYKARDIVAARRETDEMLGERWVAVTDLELTLNDRVRQLEALEAAKTLPSPEKPQVAPIVSESSEPSDGPFDEANHIVAPRERPGDAF
jgi:hypothetical protein